jgi:septum formation topological specificity factor MinE
VDLGRESKGKEPRRVHAYIRQQIPKKTAWKSLQEKCQENAPKITKKENREELKQALRNHVESSMHTMKVHHDTRSHHEALKLVLDIPRAKEEENSKTK